MEAKANTRARRRTRSLARILVIPVLLLGLPAAVVSSLASPAAASTTLTDPLNDWSLTAGHSANLTFDTSSPNFFGGDTSRVKRTQDTVESFYYNRADITDYTIKVHYRNPNDSSQTGAVDVLSSPDGVTWTYFDSAKSAPTAFGGNWYRITYTPGGALPANTNHLKINIANDPDVFTPQIGEVTLTYGCSAPPKPPLPQPGLADKVGITHVAGDYNFTTKDFLNEGADEVMSTGTHVIKLWFTPTPQLDYPFNSTWPTITDFVQEAEVSYYQGVFTRPQFNTFILVAYPVGDAVWADGMTAAEVASVKDKFYQFAKYLFDKPAYAGKTFILQNWEGDNAMGDDFSNPIKNQGMIHWLNARQDGITQARDEVGGCSDTRVYGAVEANLIDNARAGVKQQFVDKIVPFTHADLYSYSQYDAHYNPQRMRDNLQYLKTKAPDSAAFGADNVMVGEYGSPQLREDVQTAQRQRDHTYVITKAAVDWGARYVVYWEVYDNEGNGFWIKDNNGNRPPVWQFFWDISNNNAFPPVESPPPPGPATFTDELDSFIYVDRLSTNMRFDWTNSASSFGGDPWRAKRTSDTDEWMQYHKTNITNFTVRLHFEGTDPSNKYAFEISSDGASWSAIAVTAGPPMPSGTWTAYDFQPSGPLPSGTNYLRVHAKNYPQIYAPQIGRVVINYVQP